MDLVVDVVTKADMVLKRCNVDHEDAMNTTKKEVHLLQQFKGPYVVELLDYAVILKNRNQREALLLLRFCPGGKCKLECKPPL